jgi:hypothetical protein
MTLRDAIRVLMLSPLYFQLPALQRLQLAKEYCQAINTLAVSSLRR